MHAIEINEQKPNIIWSLNFRHFNHQPIVFIQEMEEVNNTSLAGLVI